MYHSNAPPLFVGLCPSTSLWRGVSGFAIRDATSVAMVRTIVSAFAEQGAQVAFVRQIFRFFTKEFAVDLQPGAGLDPRFILACALLALMAEARREDRN